MHNEFAGGVKNWGRVQVGTWVHGQLARVGIFLAILDKETINVGSLTAKDCTCGLTV